MKIIIGMFGGILVVSVPILSMSWVIKSISYTNKNILEGFELTLWVP